MRPAPASRADRQPQLSGINRPSVRARPQAHRNAVRMQQRKRNHVYGFTGHDPLCPQRPVVLRLQLRLVLRLQGEANLSGVDSSGYVYIETAAAAAVRGANNTAACTIKVPYHWVMGSGQAGVPEVANYTAGYTISALSTSGTVIRTSTGAVPVSTVPANGATTNLTFNITF